MSTIKLKIDGEYVTTRPGKTVLDVARENDRFIPALCHLDGLCSVGACRLCLVEVSSVARLLPACTTPVKEGMVVVTNSDRLTKYRKMLLELLLSERNHLCAVCVSNGNCELQSWAARYGVTHTSYPYRYPNLPVDSPRIPASVLDHNRCIMCTRCVRVCRDVEGASVWGVKGRGIHCPDCCRSRPEMGPMRTPAPAVASASRHVRSAPWLSRVGPFTRWRSIPNIIAQVVKARGGMPDEQQWKTEGRHDLAGWLFGLSHVVPGHRREPSSGSPVWSTSSTGRWSTPRKFPMISMSP